MDLTRVMLFENLQYLIKDAEFEGLFKNVNDEEFTPGGPRKYNSYVYKDKIERLSEVLAKVGREKRQNEMTAKIFLHMF